jgi:hypothetical protein
MRNIQTLIFAIIVLSLLPIGAAAEENTIDYDAYRASWDLLQTDGNVRTCVENSVIYARNNTGYGFAIISPNPKFHHQPHMVNYKIEGDTFIIYDSSFSYRYQFDNFFPNASIFMPYHRVYPDIFDEQWDKEIFIYLMPTEKEIIRAFISLDDNRDEFFDYNATAIIEKVPITSTVEQNNTIVNTTVSSSNQSTTSDVGIYHVIIALIKNILYPN